MTRVRVLRLAALLGFLVAVFFLCAFKILDRDFWWHITAGKVMLENGRMIAMEPFSYTRAGLPYLATHEWLAQLVLSVVWSLGGIKGTILFRTVMMAATFLTVLAIDGKRLWPNAAIAVAAAGAAAGTFLERPQLFTFVILALQLFLALRYLDLESENKNAKRWIVASMIGLQVLWVNFHGAAALVGIGIIGALSLQRGCDIWRQGDLRRAQGKAEILLLGGACIGATVALFLSPNGLHTVDYLHRLLTDQTIAFISEWRPREHGYWFYVLPFWLFAGGFLLWTRRKLVFSLIVLGALGWMSLRAVRHEPLFLIVALSIALYQLKHNARWHHLLDRLSVRPVAAIAASLLLMGIVAAFASSSYRQVVERDHLWGYGVFAPAKGAADFVERENIRGNMFNTYGIGGYLIHRFYPDPERKVFIDGRNVDYGFAFMNEAFVAGHSPAEWQVIEDKYDLTFAFVDYDAIKQPGWLSYSHVLDADPSWPMVYIDDWTAVYLKDLPQNKAAIEKHRYKILTAEGLEFSTVLGAPKEEWADLEAELKRAMDSSPDSVKTRILLAKHLIRQDRTGEALTIADTIEAIQPHRPDASALRASIAVTQQDWVLARKHFLRMFALAGDDYPDINYAFVADIYEKAGDFEGAQRLRKNLKPNAAPKTAETMPETTAAQAGTGAVLDLLSGIQEDITSNNDAAVAAAEAGDFKAAREAFMKALMLDPGNPLTLSNLCALEVQEGNFTQAVQYGERALTRGEEFPDAHYNLALAYAKSGDLEKALTHAERAEELGKDTASFIEWIGRQ